MRKLIIFLFFAPLFATAQNYGVAYNNTFPLPTSGGEWVVATITRKNESIDYQYSFATYYISGSEMINGKQYQKLYYKKDLGEPLLYGWLYVGITNSQVFYKSNNVQPDQTTSCHSDNEFLLYDFSYNRVGSTINYDCGNMSEQISEIDSIALSDYIFKRYNLNHNSILGDYWIEFIGSTRGILAPITVIPTSENYIRQELVCFKHNNELLYLNDNYTDCSTVITNTDDTGLNVLILYPNPADNQIYISCRVLVVSMEIYTTTGLLIKATEVKQHISDYPINCSSYDSGIYILKMRTINGSIITRKLVIK